MAKPEASVTSATSTARAPGHSPRTFRLTAEITMLLIILLVAAFVYAVNPNFATVYNLQVLTRAISVFALLAIAETMIIITAGIDLSAGSVLALTGIVAAMLLRNGYSYVEATAAAMAAALVIGLWHGLAVAKIGMNPFIVTLGTLSIARGISVTLTHGAPITNLPDPYLELGRGFVFQIVPIPVVIALVAVVYGIFILNFTPLGRYIYAIGGNKEAARLAGIPVDRVLIFVYAQAPIFYAVAAIIMMGRLGQGYPGAGGGYEFRAVTAAVLGGTSLFGGVGTVLGAVLGSVLMGQVDNGLVLIRADPYIQDIVIGTIIVLAVLIDVLRQRRAQARKAGIRTT